MLTLVAEALERNKPMRPALRAYIAKGLRAAASDPRNADRALGLRESKGRPRNRDRNIRIATEFWDLRRQNIKAIAAVAKVREGNKTLSTASIQKIVKDYKITALATLQRTALEKGDKKVAEKIGKKLWAEFDKAEKKTRAKAIKK